VLYDRPARRKSSAADFDEVLLRGGSGGWYPV